MGQTAGLPGRRPGAGAKKKPAGAMDGPAGVKWRGQDSSKRGFTRECAGGPEGTNAKSNAVPSDLAQVVAAWERLPAAIRAGILALVHASDG
jgi:hypothetical protein